MHHGCMRVWVCVYLSYVWYGANEHISKVRNMIGDFLFWYVFFRSRVEQKQSKIYIRSFNLFLKYAFRLLVDTAITLEYHK